jgi:hypothetical protein
VRISTAGDRLTSHGFTLSPSLRVRGEGRDEGAYPQGSESRGGPLTLASLDLSPHSGER